MYTLNLYGTIFKGDILRGKYQTNGNLAIVFRQEGEEDLYTFPLTSNVDEVLPEGCALLDVNNLPMHELESLLEDNHIAEPTGDFRASGFVIYPEYRFFPEALEKMEFVE
ncbi:MAG: hypothetical protein DBY43_05635 [Clostridiaceae bacterium]|nr:MAG: hypothetical protein DBY43_05635 [Clostridiaceae bacterium]